MLDFIVKYYVIFIILAFFLIFALIGYAVDSTKNKKIKEKELLNKPNEDGDITMIRTDEPLEEEEVMTSPADDIPDDDAINMNTEMDK